VSALSASTGDSVSPDPIASDVARRADAIRDSSTEAATGSARCGALMDTSYLRSASLKHAG
jgi:hypothetical protein